MFSYLFWFCWILFLLLWLPNHLQAVWLTFLSAFRAASLPMVCESFPRKEVFSIFKLEGVFNLGLGLRQLFCFWHTRIFLATHLSWLDHAHHTTWCQEYLAFSTNILICQTSKLVVLDLLSLAQPHQKVSHLTYEQEPAHGWQNYGHISSFCR